MKGWKEMELDRALELAVVSAWDELILTDDPCCIHVEYKTGSGRALRLVEVWTIGNTGYGTLAFRYRAARSESSAQRLEDRAMRFGNSYRSDILASNFDFIMKNQGDFTKPQDRSIHGGIQIETPTAEDRKSAAAWKRSIQKPPIKTNARAGFGLK
jgi:hypothetical protein